MDIKVVLDLDSLIKCIIEGRIPSFRLLSNVVLPSEVEGSDAVLIVRR